MANQAKQQGATKAQLSYRAKFLNPESIEFLLSGSATDKMVRAREQAQQQREEYAFGCSKMLDWCHRDGRGRDYTNAVAESMIEAFAGAGL